MKLNKKVEKIRDDLYVKKVAFGYKPVYPLKDHDGKPIKGNFTRLIMRDLIESIPTLIVVFAVLIMLVPGAYNIKEQCETSLEQCIDDSCDICLQKEAEEYNPGRFGIVLNVSEDFAENVG